MNIKKPDVFSPLMWGMSVLAMSWILRMVMFFVGTGLMWLVYAFAAPRLGLVPATFQQIGLVLMLLISAKVATAWATGSKVTMK